MTRPGIIELREVAPPAPPGSCEILVRVRCIGVCGSDIHVWHGKHPFTSYPVVQGHEYSATVEAVGPGVTDIRVGMKVTARPQVACGACAPCRRGDYHICNNLKVQGFQAPGCAQDLFVVPQNRIIPLPESLTFEQGALIEPLAVAAHATGRAGDMHDRNVLVLGAGTIGNLVAQAARCRGAGKVLVTDTSSFRLEKALACGADAVCNVAGESLSTAARKVFRSEGIDVAFEAAGAESALDDAVQNLKKGGTILVLGVFAERPRVDMAAVGDRELNLVGSLMYKHEDYQQAVGWITKHAVNTEPLITRHFPLERYADAYRYLEAQGDKTLKVMIDVN